MNQTYLVVFEKGESNWSAFAPDVPGTGGTGQTVDETRESLRAGIGFILEHAMENDLSVPMATTTSVDFAEFDPDHTITHYEVEWMTVNIPTVYARPAHGLRGVA